MSRLDQHISSVRNKLALGRFVEGLAVAGLGLASMALGVIVVDKLVQVRPPYGLWLLLAGLGLMVLSALIYAIRRRPSTHDAAVAIDGALGLKEKFSTALYARPIQKEYPFAAAAVRDAEESATGVSLGKHFPLRLPRIAYPTLIVALVAYLLTFLTPLDLFGKAAQAQKRKTETAKVEQARKTVEQALATVNSYPKSVANEDAIKLAKRELEALLSQPIKDPASANRSAMKALQDSSTAIAQKMKENKDFAKLQQDQKAWKMNLPPADEKGPIAEAQRAMAKGEYDKAISEVQKAVENFNKMDEPEQKKAVEQMANLAKQLQQQANDPKAQQQMAQQIQKQMQQAGMNQQQAQQMAQQVAQAMQQAAQGNPQAQQQLQQLQQQAMKAMNNGQGPNAQQQQAMQQMMQAMQAQAGNQAQAQQMAQAAQQMAQAMAKAQQGQQANQNGQGQNPQQGQGQMQQAGNNMQQQLQQMQAIAADAQQMAAAQQAAQQGMQQAAQNLNQGQGQGQNQGQGDGKGQGPQGEWAQGDPKGQGNGQGGPGIGNGGRGQKSPAPFGTKAEMSPSLDREEGRILASTFVKAGTIKGESKAQLQNVAASAMQDATDEVDQDRVSRQAQKVVKDYFETMQKE